MERRAPGEGTVINSKPTQAVHSKTRRRLSALRGNLEYRIRERWTCRIVYVRGGCATDETQAGGGGWGGRASLVFLPAVHSCSVLHVSPFFNRSSTNHSNRICSPDRVASISCTLLGQRCVQRHYLGFAVRGHVLAHCSPGDLSTEPPKS